MTDQFADHKSTAVDLRRVTESLCRAREQYLHNSHQDMQENREREQPRPKPKRPWYIVLFLFAVVGGAAILFQNPRCLFLQFSIYKNNPTCHSTRNTHKTRSIHLEYSTHLLVPVSLHAVQFASINTTLTSIDFNLTHARLSLDEAYSNHPKLVPSLQIRDTLCEVDHLLGLGTTLANKLSTAQVKLSSQLALLDAIFETVRVDLERMYNTPSVSDDSDRDYGDDLDERAKVLYHTAHNATLSLLSHLHTGVIPKHSRRFSYLATTARNTGYLVHTTHLSVCEAATGASFFVRVLWPAYIKALEEQCAAWGTMDTAVGTAVGAYMGAGQKAKEWRGAVGEAVDNATDGGKGAAQWRDTRGSMRAFREVEALRHVVRALVTPAVEAKCRERKVNDRSD